MSTIMKVGDRVRVTSMKSGYSPGDRGKVIWGPYNSASGKGTYYLVRMDVNPALNGTVFLPGEIEPDASPPFSPPMASPHEEKK